MRRVRYRWAVAATCAIALIAAGADVALAAESRAPLADTGYDPSDGLTDTGPAATGDTVSDNIYLSVRDPDALAAEAKSVSTPGSPNYGRYTTPDRIQADSQLDPAQIAQVRDWLFAAGLTVSQPNWRILRVTGTLGQLASAFDVTFDDYYPPSTWNYPYHFLIPSTDLSVPANLGSLVLGIGTNTFARAKTGGNATANAAAATVNHPAELGGVTYPHTNGTAWSADSTCSRYWGELPATGLPVVNGATPPQAPCGYTPSQLRHAYGLDKVNLTGQGQTIAVVTPAMDTLEQDVNTWSEHIGTPPLRPGQLTVVPTPDGSPAASPSSGGLGGMIENTLDVEAVHGMAPGADIISVGLSTQEGGAALDSLVYILERTRASIVSVSMGFYLTPGMRQAYDQVYQEGARQGVGFYFASGDGGTVNDTGSFLNPASSSVWETSVGGTSLAIGPGGSREWETGWGDGVNTLSSDGTSWQQPIQQAGGAGGGWATGEPEPWYQRGIVPDSLAKGPDGQLDRVGPDVAMDADGATGMLVGGTPLDGSPTTDPSTWHYVEYGIGGTSLATPLFAAVQALAQQARGGKPLGFANPALYQRAGSPAIRDISKYTLPGGAAPVAVVHREVNGTDVPLLYSMLGQMPVTPPSPLTPSTGPGFDTETGIGVPTGAYPWSYVGTGSGT
ncbi:MAG TPA: protease pro-enzyme activation domain-containing protein [Pseudonocardiaceae bacterium]|jgi:subtilase family serine protease|nr:protease pro-enzyme activation domain-containing protein [Pseudonocardiaceae bacterium]